VRRIFAIILFSLALSGVVLAEDLFNGDWKLVPSKAKAPPGPVTQFLRIKCDEASIAIMHRGIGANGQPVQWELKADLDGKLSGVVGVPGTDSVRCWRTDPRTMLIKIFQNTLNTGFWTAEVSRNGKSLKITSTAFDAAGKEHNTIDWFDKQ
jgi:hypothetical protein